MKEEAGHGIVHPAEPKEESKEEMVTRVNLEDITCF